MKNRSVSRLLYAQMVDMGGIPVRQPLPTQQVDLVDPFLLLHHARLQAPRYVEPRHAGIGPHPHRGFSPVTFIFKGGVHHRDSRGNDSVIYEGGAQWMNAGRGIIHSERPPVDIHERGGIQELIQLWINTPAKHKMDQPMYFPVSADEVPEIHTPDKRATIRLFAGELLDKKGPVPSQTEVIAATLFFDPSGKVQIPLPPHHNVMLYLLDGEVNIGDYGKTEGLHLVLFNNDGDGLTIEGVQPTRALLLSGKPLNEEVVSYGPFVMNTQTQILEAMRDYQMGRMGVLIED
ncbi:MAG: pirin family protein [Cyclobacteriaceae bacterium]|nr:pirin family protein [Cyclobacteriaceae bacterium]MCX7636610.1 pirin family protein [Cyclobacteriaceae bacterium]MDW8331956.1 pirin family protein [Cyclobacteriaceae bacterium]